MDRNCSQQAFCTLHIPHRQEFHPCSSNCSNDGLSRHCQPLSDAAPFWATVVCAPGMHEVEAAPRLFQATELGHFGCPRTQERKSLRSRLSPRRGRLGPETMDGLRAEIFLPHLSCSCESRHVAVLCQALLDWDEKATGQVAPTPLDDSRGSTETGLRQRLTRLDHANGRWRSGIDGRMADGSMASRCW